MKKFAIFLLLVGVTLIFHSCTPIMKLIYGVHNPRLESVYSLEKHARKKQLNTAIVLIPKDISSFMLIFSYFKAVPDLNLYGSDGVRLRYYLNQGCNAPVFDFIDSICLGNYTPVDTMKNLSEILSYLKPLNPNDSMRFLESQKKNPKYTSIITYNSQIGRLNKDHVRPWLDGLNKHGDCILNTYLLNLDFIDGVWSKESFKNVNIRYK